MTLTLEVPPAVEKTFRAGAARRGLAEAEYLRELLERDAAPSAAALPICFSSDPVTRRAQLRQLLTAPPDLRAATLKATGQAAAEYYASPEGRGELADWRALDGEAFHDD